MRFFRANPALRSDFARPDPGTLRAIADTAMARRYDSFKAESGLNVLDPPQAGQSVYWLVQRFAGSFCDFLAGSAELGSEVSHRRDRMR